MLSPNNHSEYFPRYPVHYLKVNVLPHFLTIAHITFLPVLQMRNLNFLSDFTAMK